MLPESPKLMPFELEKTTVPDVAVWVPPPRAAIPAAAPGWTVAVIVFPFRPNETPFEFEKMTSPTVTWVVPALTLWMPPAAEGETEAVTTLPLSPNDTPLAFDRRTVPEVAVCVPAAIAGERGRAFTAQPPPSPGSGRRCVCRAW